MEKTRWSLESAYGLAETEQLHPAFFAELGKLASMPDDQFITHFDLFVSHFEKDLRAEEQWMEGIHFASIKEHRGLHAEVLGLLHKAQARGMVGDVSLARRITALLPEWFVDHVVTMDIPLANALRLATSKNLHAEPMLDPA